jgi:N-acylneuraminate cytidylyltransferase
MVVPDISSNLIVVIPARSGSKSIVDKNLQLVGKYSLLEHSILSAKSALPNVRVLVSTDSKAYADLAISCGAEVPYLRPRHLATDSSTDYDVFKDLVEQLEGLDEQTRIMHLRPTTPLRDPHVLIEACVTDFELDPSWTSLRSVHEMSESAYKCFQIDSEGQLDSLAKSLNHVDSNGPRQAFPKTYSANGYVDILRVGVINSTGSIHGGKIFPFQTSITLEVDSLEDLHLIRLIEGSNYPERQSH